MKIKKYMLVFLLVTLTSLSYDHSIKMSASLVEYNPNNKKIRVECRVFIDDFDLAMNEFSKQININDFTEEDKKLVEDYFNRFYVITINKEKISLKYKVSDVMKDANILTIQFSDVEVSLKKGDELSIENTLFFNEFGYRQTNHITIMFPPFIMEHNNKTDMENKSFSYTL